jgi:predicted DCC family thiol-disulfide oxidoreductase YuxK
VKPIASLTIIYDGHCPFCSSYVSHLRLRNVAHELKYIDARGGGPIVAEAVQQGFNLDNGMVVIIDSSYYCGGDALQILASLTSPVNLFNRFNAKLLTSGALSQTLYPILRFGRNLTLLLLGRQRLTHEHFHNLGRSDDSH